MNNRQILLSMGYRESRVAGTWLKPVGFNLFLYSEGRSELLNYFRGKNGQLTVYDGYDFDAKGSMCFEGFLKHSESYCTLVELSSEFNFLDQGVELCEMN